MSDEPTPLTDAEVEELVKSAKASLERIKKLPTHISFSTSQLMTSGPVLNGVVHCVEPSKILAIEARIRADGRRIAKLERVVKAAKNYDECDADDPMFGVHLEEMQSALAALEDGHE